MQYSPPPSSFSSTSSSSIPTPTSMAADHAMYLSLRWPMLLGQQQQQLAAASSSCFRPPAPLAPRASIAPTHSSDSAFSTVTGGGTALPPISSLKSSSSSALLPTPRSLPSSLHLHPPPPRHPAFPPWLQPPSYLAPPPSPHAALAHQTCLQDKASAAALQAMHLLQHDPLAKAALMDLSRMGGSCYPLGKKLFGCPQCRYITDRKNNLKRHVATMHQDCDKMLECCGVMFKNKASLRDHVLIFHSNGYMCRYCGRNFCRKALLKRHLTVHSGQKDFLCEHCDYATSHKSNLERHKRVHERGEDEDEEACHTVTSSSDLPSTSHLPTASSASTLPSAHAQEHEDDIDLLDGLSDMEDIDVESTAPVSLSEMVGPHTSLPPVHTVTAHPPLPPPPPPSIPKNMHALPTTMLPPTYEHAAPTHVALT